MNFRGISSFVFFCVPSNKPQPFFSRNTLLWLITILKHNSPFAGLEGSTKKANWNLSECGSTAWGLGAYVTPSGCVCMYSIHVVNYFCGQFEHIIVLTELRPGTYKNHAWYSARDTEYIFEFGWLSFRRESFLRQPLAWHTFLSHSISKATNHVIHTIHILAKNPLLY